MYVAGRERKSLCIFLTQQKGHLCKQGQIVSITFCSPLRTEKAMAGVPTARSRTVLSA